MYTSQHPDDRGIFLEYHLDSNISFKRIYPFKNGKPDSSLAGLEFLYPHLPQLLVFPSSVNAFGPEWEKVRRWADKKNGQKISGYKVFVLVTEPKWDLSTCSFTSKTLFRHEL
jgi:hypothetical protein